MIDGVIVKDLKVIKDDRGGLFEIIRSDEPNFTFGQVYITQCNPGYIKAWHYHKLQTDRWVVIKGIARIVLYDTRPESSTFGQDFDQVFNEYNPRLLTIPKGVVHGFENISISEQCWIMNIPDQLFNYKEPDEYRLPFNDPSIVVMAWYNQKGG